MGLFRLALACSVLLEHSKGHGLFGLGFITGRLAVQSFFIISGFYMALVLNEKYLGPGRYWTFLQQRFLRLYPAYIIILFIILLVDGVSSMVTKTPFGCYQPWFQNGHLLSPSAWILLIENNLNLLGQDMVSLLQLDQTTGTLSFFNTTGHRLLTAHFFFVNRPSWTLGVELAFYLLAPLLVCRSAMLQATVLLVSLALRCCLPYWIEGQSLWTYLTSEGIPWTYAFFPSNLCFFMAGSLGYLFYKQNRSRIDRGDPAIAYVDLLRIWRFRRDLQPSSTVASALPGPDPPGLRDGAAFVCRDAKQLHRPPGRRTFLSVLFDPSARAPLHADSFRQSRAMDLCAELRCRDPAAFVAILSRRRIEDGTLSRRSLSKSEKPAG